MMELIADTVIGTKNLWPGQIIGPRGEHTTILLNGHKH